MELLAWAGILAHASISSIAPKFLESTNLPHLKLVGRRKVLGSGLPVDRGLISPEGFTCRAGPGKRLVGEEAMLRKRFGLVLVPGEGEACRGGCQGAAGGIGGCCHTGKAVPGSQITLGGVFGGFTPLLLNRRKKKKIHRYSEIPHSTQTHHFLFISPR